MAERNRTNVFVYNLFIYVQINNVIYIYTRTPSSYRNFDISYLFGNLRRNIFSRLFRKLTVERISRIITLRGPIRGTRTRKISREYYKNYRQ